MTIAASNFRSKLSAFFNLFAIIFLFLSGAMVLAQEPAKPAAKAAVKPAVSLEAKVDALLKQMTLDEKLAIIHGSGEPATTDQAQAGYMAGVPRLGIPTLRLADGPPGVLTRIPSTAPVSTMGLAATFSRADAKANGELIAREARACGIDVILQPFINIDRDLAYGRGYNTYGEDPFLTGQIGAEFIRGAQGQGIMAQAKHYIAYDTNGGDVWVDQQALREIYAAPFADASEAGVSSIMCSYNHVNGPYACGNSDTLNGILKKEIGFKGFVTSDWGATHATDYINAGLDQEMPGPIGEFWAIPAYFDHNPTAVHEAPDPDAGVKDELRNALPEEPAQKGWGGFGKPPAIETTIKSLIAEGKVNEERVNEAARRILMQMAKFGLLDGKPTHTIAPSAIEANAKVNLKTAEDAAVLLKNEGALPLKAEDLKSLAIIGPGAAKNIAIGYSGEKALGLPERQIGALDILKKIPGAKIVFATANDLQGTPIPAEFFSHEGKPGLLRTDSYSRIVQADAQIDFTKSNGKALPANTTMRWEGMLNVPEDGNYRLHLQVLGCWANMVVDGKRVARIGRNVIHGDLTQATQDDVAATVDNLDNVRMELNLTKGPHTVSVDIRPDTSNAPAQVRLSWVTPQQQKANYEAAIAAAKSSKTAIVFAWSRTYPLFGLPGGQDKLISDIAAVNPNTIVVLNVSQPVAMPWIDKVKGVLQMWWSGDEGGWATANVLLGKKNPAGRLPFTWARKLEDMPAADPNFPERSAKGVDGKTTFSEGIFVGYRWFDKQNTEPLFAFGHGLSYTKFEYSKLAVEVATDVGLDVTFTVKNTGKVAGEEVPQVYLGAPSTQPEGAQFAVRAFAAFDRVSLAPGESKTLTLHVRPRQLEFYSVVAKAWQRAQGERTVFVGDSSRDLPLKQTVYVPGPGVGVAKVRVIHVK